MTDIRNILDQSDFKEIAEILKARKEGNYSALQVETVTNNGTEETLDSLQAATIRRCVKYYLTLKILKAEVVKRMIDNNINLDLDHWKGAIYPALQAIDDPHVRALSTDQWYGK